MAYPQQISIYLKSTGVVVQTMFVNAESDINIDSDHAFIVGGYKPNAHKIVDGTAQSYSPSYVTGTNTAAVRKQRDELLLASDWTQGADSPLTDSKKAEWVTYRQALRDMMASYTDNADNTVAATTFPTEPS